MNIHDMTWLREDDSDMFARRAAGWLAMHRITHAELATTISISPWALSRLLNGKRAFPVPLAHAVSHYTGLPLTGTTITYNPDHARH
jgi:Helix-turn-helix